MKNRLQRIRQSGWYDIGVALLLLSALLFIAGSIWQATAPVVRPGPDLATARDIPISYGLDRYTPLFLLSEVLLIIALILMFHAAILSPWFHRSPERLVYRRHAAKCVRYVCCFLIILVLLFPVYWMLAASLRVDDASLQDVADFIPDQMTLDHYRQILNLAPFRQYILNTLIMAGIMLLGEVTLGTLAAYGFSKGRFKGRNALFTLVLCSITIPVQSLYVPLYSMASRLHWVNTFPGLILPNLVTGFFIFLMRQAFISVEESYLDAAKIDGMGRIQSIVHVLIPMCKPTFITACLLTFIKGWNSYIWPKMITPDGKRRTIALGLQYLRQTEAAHYNEIMAGAVLAVLPVVILFIMMNQYIMTSKEPQIK